MYRTKKWKIIKLIIVIELVLFILIIESKRKMIER